MACGNYVCGSNENLKLCFQCDTLFCDNCAPAGTDFDENIDPEEIYCGGCVPNECDKCGDKSYKYSTESCPQLGEGYYCYECIEESKEEQKEYDEECCMSGCSGKTVYKSKTESYYCEEHKIAFYCEVCGIDIWRDGHQHDESKCDETGEKWYCPNCDEKEEAEYERCENAPACGCYWDSAIDEREDE